MTPRPSLPNQRGRRKAFAIAVLTVVAMCSWWYWPRGDARFVGKWRFPDEVNGYWHLKSNGLAVWTPTTPGFARLHSTWKHEGGLLRIGGYKSHPAWLNWIINEWNWRFPLNQWSEPGHCLKVLCIEPAVLKCVEADYPEDPYPNPEDLRHEPIVLTRIPE